MPRKKKAVPKEEVVSKKEKSEEKPLRDEPFYYPKLHCEGCGELKKSNQILMDSESKKLLCKPCKPKVSKDESKGS
jgi:hypothetical protein